jgi:hypothetical protein
MSTVKVLNEIKDFLKRNVTPNIKLRLPNDKDSTEYTLVNPDVHVGWIPPKEYLPPGVDFSVPCIVVGFDDGEDDNINSDYKIRLTVVVYSQLFSPHAFATNEQNHYSNFDGYVELLNLIDITKANLRKHTIINNYIKIDSNIQWGMYQEQPLPYWYGYMTFTVSNKAYPATNLESKLNNL